MDVSSSEDNYVRLYFDCHCISYTSVALQSRFYRRDLKCISIYTLLIIIVISINVSTKIAVSMRYIIHVMNKCLGDELF
jgi:hypothetical protein